MKLLLGLTKVWKHLFKKEKAPKATNEMKPVEMDKYIVGFDPHRLNENIPDEFFQPKIWDEEGRRFVQLRLFINESYWKVKYSWKRSPKKYFVWINKTGNLELRRYVSSIHEEDKLIGKLYTLYQQYYGQKDNN